jgi:hypothetical protein
VTARRSAPAAVPVDVPVTLADAHDVSRQVSDPGHAVLAQLLQHTHCIARRQPLSPQMVASRRNSWAGKAGRNIRASPRSRRAQPCKLPDLLGNHSEMQHCCMMSFHSRLSIFPHVKPTPFTSELTRSCQLYQQQPHQQQQHGIGPCNSC